MDPTIAGVGLHLFPAVQDGPSPQVSVLHGQAGALGETLMSQPSRLHRCK